MKLLEINNLCISFDGDNVANDHLSVELEKGDRLAVIGESGSGKTMLCLTIMGLVPMQAKIKMDKFILKDKSMINADKRTWRQIRGKVASLIFQDATAMNPLMSVGKQLMEALDPENKSTYKAMKAKVMSRLGEVHFPLDREPYKIYPHELSGGLAQRAMIAIALAQNPEILVADEPTTSLDVRIQNEILSLLASLAHERDLSIVFVSHNLSLVYGFCNKIIVLYSGMILEEGEMREVIDNPLHPYTKGLLKSLPENNEPNKPINLMPGEIEMKKGFHNLCPFLLRCDCAVTKCKNSLPLLEARTTSRKLRCWAF